MFSVPESGTIQVPCGERARGEETSVRTAMTKDEERHALREDNRILNAVGVERQLLKEPWTRIKNVEGRWATPRRTRSTPPSSDVLACPPRSARRPNGTRPGGQPARTF